MLKYLFLILIVLGGVFFYLNYHPVSLDQGSIKVGEVLYVRGVGKDSLSAFLQRISPTQVLFAFIRDGEQPQVDKNPESSYNFGGEFFVFGGGCKIKFDSLEPSYRGLLKCNNLNELKIRAFPQLSNLNEAAIQLPEDQRGKTGEILAKIEQLSDEILNKTLEMNDSERMIAMFKEGSISEYGESSPDSKPIKKLPPPAVTRSSFLRASKEGQEINLASRLLDEEAKVILKMQKYSAEAMELGGTNTVPDSGEVPIGADSMPNSDGSNANQISEGEWWKDL